MTWIGRAWSYTIMFLTALVMLMLGVIPLSLMIENHGNPTDHTLLWGLFVKVEAVVVIILTFNRAIVRSKKALGSKKEDCW